MKKEENSNKEGKKAPVAKSSSGPDAKGERKKSIEHTNEDPKLQEFLQIMQPRINSKLWANDSAGSPLLDQNNKVSAKQTQLKSKQVDVAEVDERELQKQTDEKSKLAHDEVISDMDYFKSRVKKDWSDSESGDDDEDHDDNKSNHSNQTRDVSVDKIEEEGPVEADVEMINSSENPPSSFEDEKQEDLETGRLFIRNLPYTATY